MDPRTTVLTLYYAVLASLTLFGAHRWLLLWLHRRHRRRASAPCPPDASWRPTLTVQVPLFNELHVARRVVDAVAALDWPADRLEIQVLDDSTDETTAVVAESVAAARRRGIDAVHVRRGDRVGFKAGALAEGLRRARGEFVAVFDADFVPSPSFARELMGHFNDPRVGMVQARWGHLNRRASLLTRAQAMLLDGHFVIEHAARHRSGRFFNFNGTAGIWRRECIVDAGGWQHDTLTEDLDLSYRAQMRGWTFVFVEGSVAPAELPIEMGAFKTQQHRWAKGSAQTAVKLLPAVLRGHHPVHVKLESIVHLTANGSYVLMVLLALLLGPAVWYRRGASIGSMLLVDLPVLVFSLASIATFYMAARRDADRSTGRAWRDLPVLMAVGVGLSITNARAVIAGLVESGGEFRRTPKYGLDPSDGAALATRRYRAGLGAETWIELALGLYFAALVVLAPIAGAWGAMPFLGLFASGFLYTSGLTLAQSRRRA